MDPFTQPYHRFIKTADYDSFTGERLRRLLFDNVLEAGGNEETAQRLSGFADILTRHNKAPDFQFNSLTLPRSVVSFDDFNKDDLKMLGFVPSLVAVPERGQRAITTWRHPYTGAHLHKHKENWMLHDDKWPSLSMVSLQNKLENPDQPFMDRMRYNISYGLKKSLPHVVYEGIPGYVNYTYNSILGMPTISEVMKGTATQPDLLEKYKGAGLGVLGASGLAALLGLLREKTIGDREYSKDDMTRSVFGGGGAMGGFLAGKTLANNIHPAIVERFGSDFAHPGLKSLTVSTGLPLLGAGLGFLGGRGLSTLFTDNTKKDEDKEERDTSTRPAA
jgi:hypothetical protein